MAALRRFTPTGKRADIAKKMASVQRGKYSQKGILCRGSRSPGARRAALRRPLVVPSRRTLRATCPEAGPQSDITEPNGADSRTASHTAGSLGRNASQTSNAPATKMVGKMTSLMGVQPNLASS